MPSRWLFLLKYDINVDAINENFQNSRCTLIKFLVEENLVSWHPKTHVPRNCLQSFYLAALINKFRKQEQYPYAEFLNVSAGIRTRSFQKENNNNETNNSYPNIRKVMGQIFGCEFIIRRRQRSYIVITLFLKWSCPSACSKI